ncbi:MAG TPA: ATP-binding protein [Candidatus Kapabacteria bacterium]|nr:ATP-binding protein [Candidatus Kapabacteria bacterium]
MDNLNQSSKLLNLINEYTEHIFLHFNIFEVINQALKVFYNVPNSKYASLFILNEETFEFDYRAVYPFIDKSIVISDFNRLVDIGVVGEVIDTRRILNYELKHLDFEITNYIIIPLLIPNSIIAIVLIRLEKGNEIQEELFTHLLTLFSNHFSFIIQNDNLEKLLNKAQALLEQKVVARTLSLSQGKRELQTILDSIQAGVIIIDSQTNKIISVNPVAAFIIGEEYENIVGRSPNDFFNFEDEKRLGITDNLRFSRNFESEICNSNGDTIPILRTMAKINLGDQKYRIESFFDITEQKMTEIALKQANEMLELKVQERTEDLQILIHKLQNEIFEREKAEKEVRKMLDKEKELNELKTRFISMVSHEFKTPLTVISTSVELLQEFINNFTVDEKNEYFTKITKSIDLMKGLIENVLFIGQAETDNLSFDPKRVDLKNLCISVIEDIKLTLKKEREFIFKYNGPYDYATLDENLIKPMLINLLNNAVKYSFDSPIELNIDFTYNDIIFSVKDYGIGIPKEEQEKIFEAFHRAKNVGAISGTGLGMSIVLRAVELHKGQIDIDSNVDKGTTFTISIPNLNLIR